MATARNRRFLAKYFHDGSWWALDIYAVDSADAEAICRKLNLQLEGEHVATIRVPSGMPFVPQILSAVCAVRNGIRNFFWGPPA